MEPDNVVVKLCVLGMQAEGEGDAECAGRLFGEAWEAAQDDYEACIAAHYVARHQATAEDTLRWNEESLRLANAVDDNRVADFYPSLLLNLGHSYEALGRHAEAKRHYDLAASHAEQLPADGYGRMVRGGIRAGRQRVTDEAP